MTKSWHEVLTWMDWYVSDRSSQIIVLTGGGGLWNNIPVIMRKIIRTQLRRVLQDHRNWISPLYKYRARLRSHFDTGLYGIELIKM